MKVAGERASPAALFYVSGVHPLGTKGLGAGVRCPEVRRSDGRVMAVTSYRRVRDSRPLRSSIV
jgi:hypothetical protein